MAVSVTITADADEVLAYIRRAQGSLDRLVQEVAEEVAQEAAAEGGKVSSRLGAEWPVEGTGRERRTVEAPEWWAHFLAGGTRDHGPRNAPRLVFEVDGNIVSALHVRGIAADPFDKRAIEAVDHRVDDIMRRVMLMGGLA